MSSASTNINGEALLERLHDIVEIDIFIGSGAIMDAKRLEGRAVVDGSLQHVEMLGRSLQQRVLNDKFFQGVGILGQIGDADSNVQETVLQRDRLEIGELSQAVLGYEVKHDARSVSQLSAGMICKSRQFSLT